MVHSCAVEYVWCKREFRLAAQRTSACYFVLLWNVTNHNPNTVISNHSILEHRMKHCCETFHKTLKHMNTLSLPKKLKLIHRFVSCRNQNTFLSRSNTLTKLYLNKLFRNNVPVDGWPVLLTINFTILNLTIFYFNESQFKDISLINQPVFDKSSEIK